MLFHFYMHTFLMKNIIDSLNFEPRENTSFYLIFEIDFQVIKKGSSFPKYEIVARFRHDHLLKESNPIFLTAALIYRRTWEYSDARSGLD